MADLECTCQNILCAACWARQTLGMFLRPEQVGYLVEYGRILGRALERDEERFDALVKLGPWAEYCTADLGPDSAKRLLLAPAVTNRRLHLARKLLRMGVDPVRCVCAALDGCCECSLLFRADTDPVMVQELVSRGVSPSAGVGTRGLIFAKATVRADPVGSLALGPLTLAAEASLRLLLTRGEAGRRVTATFSYPAANRGALEAGVLARCRGWEAVAPDRRYGAGFMRTAVRMPLEGFLEVLGRTEALEFVWAFDRWEGARAAWVSAVVRAPRRAACAPAAFCGIEARPAKAKMAAITIQALQTAFLLRKVAEVRAAAAEGRPYSDAMRAVEYLLARGADPNTAECAPEPPLLYSLCRWRGFPAELEDLVLRSPGLRLDLPAAGGPLRAEDLAREAGNLRLAEALAALRARGSAPEA